MHITILYVYKNSGCMVYEYEIAVTILVGVTFSHNGTHLERI